MDGDAVRPPGAIVPAAIFRNAGQVYASPAREIPRLQASTDYYRQTAILLRSRSARMPS
jgi:hypothetical protein